MTASARGQRSQRSDPCPEAQASLGSQRRRSGRWVRPADPKDPSDPRAEALVKATGRLRLKDSAQLCGWRPALCGSRSTSPVNGRFEAGCTAPVPRHLAALVVDPAQRLALCGARCTPVLRHHLAALVVEAAEADDEAVRQPPQPRPPPHVRLVLGRRLPAVAPAPQTPRHAQSADTPPVAGCFALSYTQAGFDQRLLRAPPPPPTPPPRPQAAIRLAVYVCV